MEITHTQKHIHTSSRKLRLVADAVRKLTPAKSLEVLQFANQAASFELAKVIKTALANAKQLKVSPDNLSFKKLEVNEGIRMKRVMSGGRGRRRIYVRKTSHVKIVLTDEKKAKNRERGITAS